MLFDCIRLYIMDMNPDYQQLHKLVHEVNGIVEQFKFSRLFANVHILPVGSKSVDIIVVTCYRHNMVKSAKPLIDSLMQIFSETIDITIIASWSHTDYFDRTLHWRSYAFDEIKIVTVGDCSIMFPTIIERYTKAM